MNVFRSVNLFRQVPPAAWVMLLVGTFTISACTWLVLTAAERGFTPV